MRHTDMGMELHTIRNDFTIKLQTRPLNMSGLFLITLLQNLIFTAKDF